MPMAKRRRHPFASAEMNSMSRDSSRVEKSYLKWLFNETDHSEFSIAFDKIVQIAIVHVLRWTIDDQIVRFTTLRKETGRYEWCFSLDRETTAGQQRVSIYEPLFRWPWRRRLDEDHRYTVVHVSQHQMQFDGDSRTSSNRKRPGRANEPIDLKYIWSRVDTTATGTIHFVTNTDQSV